jgi:hypothetical protein
VPAPGYRGALRWFHPALASLIAAIAIGGFWASYFGPLLARRLSTEPILHLHAFVFTGWVLLLVLQTALASRGRIDAHRRVGRIGVAWGLVLIGVGLATTGVRVAGLAARDSFAAAAAFLVWPLLDMVVFALLFGAAVALRRRPQWHKRLMILATTSLLVAPVARIVPAPSPTAGNLFFGDSVATHAVFMLAWLAPSLIAAAHDLWRDKRVHPAYAAGLALIVLTSFRDQIVGHPAWQAVARWVITTFS